MCEIKIAYFGSPYFSAWFLEKLITDVSINQLIKIKLVVTQPDKPVGRKQIMTKSPVKLIAEKYKIPIHSNSNLFRDSNLEFRILLEQVDLALVFAYGQIIPKELLDIPKYGFWCIHPSLLPKYRGASPIAYPLILGEEKTGVTIIKMDEKIDHGPIIAQEEMEILPTDKRPDLEIKLTDLAFTKLKNLLIKDCASLSRSLSRCTIDARPQDNKQTTYAPYLKRDDGFIPLSTLIKSIKNEPLSFEKLPKIIKNYYLKYSFLFQRRSYKDSKLIFDLFRGLYAWPGIWTLIKINGKEKRLKITELSLCPKPYSLILISVQLEGKKEIDFKTFNKAYKVF